MVIARNGNGYRAIPVPVWPEYHGDWDFPTAYSQQPEETDFKDITGDGIPEWFIGRDVSPWGNIPGQSRDESILSWQDGRIVNLAPQSYGISMANLDDDPALELYTDYWLVDSWGCSTNSKTVYDWDGQAFTALGHPVKEKRNCEARDAEEAMWRGDFQSALRSYEAFFEANEKLYHEYTSCMLSPDGVECNYNYGVDRIAIYNYFLSRRIIAYVQLGDQQNIDKSLASLREAPYPDAFGQAILALNSSDPQKICKAAYAFFTSKTVDYGSFNEYSIFTPGEVYEDIGQYNLNLPIGLGQHRDPLKAGCDITTFSSEPTPTPTATATPAPTYTPYPTPTVEHELLNDFPSLRFRDGDYEAVIWMSDHIHERFSRFTDDALQMHYWKGLALEALGRPQEALDTYTALAKEAPDSVWADLAQLHFQ